jgi:hypothetical protein
MLHVESVPFKAFEKPVVPLSFLSESVESTFTNTEGDGRLPLQNRDIDFTTLLLERFEVRLGFSRNYCSMERRPIIKLRNQKFFIA